MVFYASKINLLFWNSYAGLVGCRFRAQVNFGLVAKEFSPQQASDAFLVGSLVQVKVPHPNGKIGRTIRGICKISSA